jgi:hypothetical protein
MRPPSPRSAQKIRFRLDRKRNSGGWTCTLQRENGPLIIKGHRLDVLVREGDVWKECISCSTPAEPGPK